MLIFVLFFVSSAHAQGCVPIVIAACQGHGYNMTSMPNLVGMEHQMDAEERLESFQPLVKFGCSSQLLFFLCTLYAPMCTSQIDTPIGPCRPLCETVQRRCSPVLDGFGFTWPLFLNCSRFPQANDNLHMCMEGPGELLPLVSDMVAPYGTASAVPGFDHCARHAYPHLYQYLNATGQCTPLCHANISFSSADKAFATAWMAVWAVLCFCVTSFTVFSFILDSSTFKYPERAAAYLSSCYSLISAGILIRLAAGATEVTCHLHPELGVGVRVVEGTLLPSCTLVFILLYYFGNAASMWWLVLCISWLLKTFKKYGHDQLMRVSSAFHVSAWGVPAAQTIACLVFRKVDSDELTGLCYTGQQHTTTLVRFVLVPQFLYLVSGSTIILVVFSRLWRTRSRLKAEGLKADRVDVTVARVGIGAMLYMIPATCMVGTTFYEYVEREKWLRETTVRPNMEVFMLKIFMNVATGIMTSLFLINNQVLNAWKDVLRRLTSPSKPLPQYLQEPKAGLETRL